MKPGTLSRNMSGPSLLPTNMGLCVLELFAHWKEQGLPLPCRKSINPSKDNTKS